MASINFDSQGRLSMRRVFDARDKSFDAVPRSTTFNDLSNVHISDRFTGLTLSPQLAIETDFKGSTFSSCNILKMNAESADFTECPFTRCYFENVTFNKATLSSAKFVECTFIRCRFVDAKLENCSFNKVWFENCSIMDADFSNSELKLVEFENCDISRTKFDGSKLDIGVLFHQSPLFETSFRNAKLNASKFLLNDMTYSDFSKAELTDCGFIVCNLLFSNFSNSTLPNYRQGRLLKKYVQPNTLAGGRCERFDEQGLDFEDMSNLEFQDLIKFVIYTNKELEYFAKRCIKNERYTREIIYELKDDPRFQYMNRFIDCDLTFSNFANISDIPSRLQLHGCNIFGMTITDERLNTIFDAFTRRTGIVSFHADEIDRISLSNVRGEPICATDQHILEYPQLLQYASFQNVKITGINFNDISFSNANLSDSTFQNCSFVNSDMSHTELNRADMRGCNFTNANFENAEIVDANFTFSNFTNTNFTNATFLGDALTFSNTTGLKTANMEGVKCSLKTFSYLMPLIVRQQGYGLIIEGRPFDEHMRERAVTAITYKKF